MVFLTFSPSASPSPLKGEGTIPKLEFANFKPMYFKMLTSSVGKKTIMAVTGTVLVGFVGMHLLGNLQIFLGSNALNRYAEHLQSLPFLLLPARFFLGITLILHVTTGILLYIENSRARPIPYHCQNTVQATWASRTMLISGIFILSFLIYHLLNFTFGIPLSQFFHLTDMEGRHDVYSMVVLSFQSIFLSGAYIAAMVFLALHLSHGISSLFQSLGLSNEKIVPFLKIAGITAAVLIFLGNSSIPFASFFKVLTFH